MTLAMHKGNDDSYVMLTTKGERLDAYWCSDYDGAGTYFVTVDADAIYEELAELATWVNNVVNEEFLIEID